MPAIDEGSKVGVDSSFELFLLPFFKTGKFLGFTVGDNIDGNLNEVRGTFEGNV